MGEILNFNNKANLFLKNLLKYIAPPERPEIKYCNGTYELTLSLVTLETKQILCGQIYVGHRTIFFPDKRTNKC
jgi:hypothetical protein